MAGFGPSAVWPVARDDATVAALDGDFAAARLKLDAPEALFAEQGVMADPDDAAEIAALRRRLDEQPRA